MSGHSDHPDERRCSKDTAGTKECKRDLIIKKILLLWEQRQRGPSGKFCMDVTEL